MAGTSNQATMTEIFGEPVSVYTRAQAIEDGELVDVSETAREAGFTFPVAVTRAVWGGYITPDDRSRPYGQSESGRLWDTVWMLKRAARQGGQILYYPVCFIMKEKLKKILTLKAVIGPGDLREPVITIMLPEED